VSRFWLVELYEDLEHLPFSPTTRGGVWAGVKSVNGVKSVTDLSAVSWQTLDALLLPEEQVSRPERVRRNARRHAVD